MAAPNGVGRSTKTTMFMNTRRSQIVPALPLPLIRPRASPSPLDPSAVSAASVSHADAPSSSVDTAGSAEPEQPEKPLSAASTEPEVEDKEAKETEEIAPEENSEEAAVPLQAAPADAEPETASTDASRRASKPAETSTPTSKSSSSDTQDLLTQPVLAGPQSPVVVSDHHTNNMAHRLSNLSFTNGLNGHQARPSSGSFVMFGGFNESSNGSPAPLSAASGGFPPPPPPPYQLDGPPIANAEKHVPPMMTSAAINGGPLIAGYRDTSTPQSLHGSQSSFPTEENGHAPYGHVNGHHDYATRSLPPGLPSVGLDPRINHGAPGPSTVDPLDDRMHEDAMFNLQHAFSEREFADCFFEVRLPHASAEESRDHCPEGREAQAQGQGQATLTIPAHRVVLARSPTLRRRLHASSTLADGVVLVYGDDRHLRADALYYAIRTLYGTPLGPILPTYSPMQSIKDQFDLALGYAAAGRFLQLDLVMFKGVRVASQLVAWDTVEKAFDYALPGYICPFTSTTGQASPSHSRAPDVWAGAVRELLNQAVIFLIQHFPRDFMLDTDPGNAAFSRLPSAFQIVPSPSSPPIARGTSIPSSANHSRQPSASTASIPQMPPPPTSRPLRHPNLAGIKFGDMSGNAMPEALPVARVQPTESETLFSRILLNLPFALLKETLEDVSLASRSGGVTLATRHKVMLDVVQERESRRIRTVEGLRRQSGPLYHYYRERLSSSEAQAVDGESDYKANNMSFKEQVVQGLEGPTLAQTWQRYDFGASG